MSTETKERRSPLDTSAAAGYLNVQPNYLEKLRCTGSGPTFIKRNGLVRYDPNDLDAWLDAGKRQSTNGRSAGALYDRVEGRQRFARIDGDQIKGMSYHAEQPRPEREGDVWVPVVHEDSEPFDLATHWRLPPRHTLVCVDGVPDRVRCTYPVVVKSWEHA
ncbi:DNA-binding protein [Bradyrhizobium canariense]|uniref:DNA-binding protein n=1 Tax=Bradyrhizobium canariense TaxID=255045 RepID=UPI000B8F95C1|nr:DNA-binding protein [Bradyrhizobium canariense]